MALTDALHMASTVMPMACLMYENSDCLLQKEGRAKALLENMKFFELPRHLTEHNHPEAAGSVMLRFVDAAVAMDPDFLR